MPNTVNDRIAANESQKEEGNGSLEATLAKLPGLPTLPQTAVAILELANNPDAVADDYYELISVDPALSVRVLKVVNSSFYGLSRQIDSIRQAIVLLGPNAVRNIAVASSMHKVFCTQRRRMYFDPQSLWRHSVTVATATRLIANRIDYSEPETAFLAGLIHDVGVIAELQLDRPRFLVLDEMATEQSEIPFRTIEEQLFGMDHEVFGAALCRVWNLPEHLEAVVGSHHRPHDRSDSHRTLVSIVHVADILATRSGTGYDRTTEQDAIEQKILDELGLTPEMLEEIEAELPEGVAENRKLFET